MSDANPTENKLTEARLAELTAQVVSAFVSNNSTPAAELSTIIKSVAASFTRQEEVSEAEEITPAVSVRKSVAPDHLVCLVCGKQQKTLKRHISTSHGMTPAEYRNTFGLRSDYPMVASAYSTARSEMAKRIGLGQKGRGGKPTKALPAPKGRRTRKPKEQQEAA